MDGMFSSRIRPRIGGSHNAGYAGHHRHMAASLLVEVFQSHPGQADDGENIQIEHLPVHLQLDVVPLGPLGSAGVVDEDVNPSEMADGVVEVRLVRLDVGHVHRNDQHILDGQLFLGQF